MCRFLLFIFEGIEFKIHWVISWLGCWVCCAVNSVGLVLGYLFVLKLYYIYHVQRCQPSLHSHVFFSSSPARVISYYFPVILNLWETDGYVIFPVILNLSEIDGYVIFLSFWIYQTDGYVILPVILNLSDWWMCYFTCDSKFVRDWWICYFTCDSEFVRNWWICYFPVILNLSETDGQRPGVSPATCTADGKLTTYPCQANSHDGICWPDACSGL